MDRINEMSKTEIGGTDLYSFHAWALRAIRKYGGWQMLRFSGWSRSDVLALAGIAVAIVIAIIPPLRHGVVRWWRAVLLRAGFPRRRYARWFVRRWGSYENPYLDDRENLDLSNTFVPLSFQAEGAELESLSSANAVLADRQAGNIVIEGVPGSGKSTLLKAYGVGLSQAGRLPGRRKHAVPFLVQLRKLARQDGEQPDIARYLVDEVLVSGAGMHPEQARRFLRYSLSNDQALVLLDGLDELTSDRYRAVHESVYQFIEDHSPDCPSYRARVIITCRRQNFLSLRDEWIPAIATGVCSLAPLRDSDMFSYVSKLRSKFKTPTGPESFSQAVKASGTTDLHRVPLILAMSVGLYARKDFYEIPSSIARLYQAMIDEMLDRQRFKRDPGGGVLRFQLADKNRFLREFALHCAAEHGGFDEFRKADLIAFAIRIARDLNAVADPGAFVDEIVDRSGLLSDVGENARYVFAHRSIQEFLAAEKLRLSGESDFLLDRAVDAEWRQVIQFYSAGLEQDQANAFLAVLAERNPALAGYCLASATPSDAVAETVLGALRPVDYQSLPALAAATLSPRQSVQRMAIDALRAALLSPDSPLSGLSGEVDALLPLLDSLAGTNVADIAAMMPGTLAQVPDDPRLVAPLWRCLAAPGIERSSTVAAIISRLLALAATTDGFDELAGQDRYAWPFLTPDLRRRAYPFDGGLSADHNLVTLLTWAEHLKVTPEPPGRYFEAKAAGQLDKVEAARRRTVTLKPHAIGFSMSVVLSIVAIGMSAFDLVDDPGSLLRPYGGWTLALFGGVALAGFGIFFVALAIGSALPARWEVLFGELSEIQLGAHLVSYSARVRSVLIAGLGALVAVFLAPVAVAIAPVPLLAQTPWAYYLIALVGGYLLWVPALDLFAKGRRLYPYRPSPYIDLYDLPGTRHWLVPAATSGRRAEPVPVEPPSAEVVTPGA